MSASSVVWRGLLCRFFTGAIPLYLYHASKLKHFTKNESPHHAATTLYYHSLSL